jgi:uncharacterized membrane protein
MALFTKIYLGSMQIINLEVKTMSLESAKNYGYIASIIFCIIPIISFITNIAVFAAFFSSFGDLIANPNAVNTDIIFSTFTYLGVIAGIGAIILITGLFALILFLIAQYRLSKYYNEPAIFRNILYSILLTIGYVIIAIIAAAILFLITATTVITTEIAPGADTVMLTPLIGTAVLVVVLSIIYVIIYALLWYRAFNKLGEKSGIDAFKTAGLLYVIGMFIPFVSLIAWIFAAKGYKQLKPQQLPTDSNYNTYTPQSPTVNRIFCSQCGTENLVNDTYCKHCGQTIQTTQTDTIV